MVHSNNLELELVGRQHQRVLGMIRHRPGLGTTRFHLGLWQEPSLLAIE